MLIPFVALFCWFTVVSVYQLHRTLYKGYLYTHFNVGILTVEIFTFLVFPYGYLSGSESRHINYCGEFSPIFSPDHSLSIYVLMALVLMSYFFCNYRKRLAAPILEIALNCLLIMGIILVVLIRVDDFAGEVLQEILIDSLFALPIVLFLILVLIKNHRLAVAEISNMPSGKPWNRWANNMLRAAPLHKYPILLLLCLPVLILIALSLLLFGQKPDSLIRAFTDTYQERFSMLKAPCIDPPPQGGHYLCTVAAKGHSNFVKPIRPGIRRGTVVSCNRQLLISNAFEELVERRTPWLHRPIRKIYDRIGSGIRKHYWILNNPWISDLIYVLMKPLEWIFLLILYTFCRKPENWIHRQYMLPVERPYISA